MANTSNADFLSLAGDDRTVREVSHGRVKSGRTCTKILVADDHAETRKSLCRVLAENGYGPIVAEAETGKQAVAEARKLRPDLVLLDLSMPELDGLSAAQIIKKQFPDVLVVIFTVHNGGLFRTLAMELGLDGFVTKGTSTKELIAALDDVCHHHKYFPA